MKALSVALPAAFMALSGSLWSANGSQPEALPPRADWSVVASSGEAGEFPASMAVDGDAQTRWSSEFADPQWLSVDLGRLASVCGVTVHWEPAYASHYSIDVSIDGQEWRTVYEQANGDGGIDDVYFRPVEARFVRLFGRKRATGWGYSVWEFEVKGRDRRVAIEAPASPNAGVDHLFDGDLKTTWQATDAGGVTLDLDFQTVKPLAGLRIDWGGVHACGIELSSSRDGEVWQRLDAPPFGAPQFEMLLHSPVEARYLRLALSEPSAPGPIEIRELSLVDLAAGGNPTSLYRVAASLCPAGVYPEQLRKRQTYWTVVGLPRDSEESLFDEWGNLEPKTGGPTLMAYVHVDGRLHAPVGSPVIAQRLVDRRLPLPSVVWRAGDIQVEAAALTRGAIDRSVTYVRYLLRNTGDQPARGKLLLGVRPMQINPPWQHGGRAPIRHVRIRSSELATAVEMGNQPVFLAMPPAGEAGVRAFDRGDVARELLAGTVPAAVEVHDENGLASAGLAYRFDLAPGERMAVVVAAPLHGAVGDLTGFRALGPDVAAAFDTALEQQATFWRQRLAGPRIELPDRKVVDTLVSQIAYILINQDGCAVQPGSRNYNRSWMRDGGSSMAALLRMGLTDDARRWLDWYAARVQPHGLVPPILTTDGEVYAGWGANVEWDSQGQFLRALVEYYRFTGDEAFVRARRDAVIGAMDFLEALRQETLEPGYRSAESAPERFCGILPPSISHEGYDPPMHSYWDDFWALKGLKDARYLGEALDWPEVAAQADRQYAELRAAVRRSIEATVRHFGIDYVPGCADKGDFDATSTAIALFPGGELELFDRALIGRTFDRYHRDLTARREPSWHGKFTPYELRSIGAFLVLDEPVRALGLLDYMLTCRRPAAWNHLGEVVYSDVRLGSYIGDMPHTWVGAEYVNGVRGMLAQEDGGRLVLLGGVPRRWLEEGEGVLIEDLPTWFGSLDLRARLIAGEFVARIGGTCRPPEGFTIGLPVAGEPWQTLVDGREVPTPAGRLLHVPSGTREIRAVAP